MAGIDFNRQVFAAPKEQAPQPASRIFGVLFLVVALVAVGLVGYKVISASGRSDASADSQGLEKIQQQLTEMEKRLDQLEKRHKASVAEPARAPATPEAKSTTTTPPPQRPAYRISAASAMPSRPSSAPAHPGVEQRAASANGLSAPVDNTANR